MANFNEHALEMSIMELFKDEGYTYVSGDQIHRERTEVLLTDDLKQYLYNRYAKDGITPSEVDSVILMLRNISGTIYEANKAVFKLLCDGFILNREDRTQKDLYIELIDFDTPENNIFKAVNQFEIEGVNNQLRIPDGIVFVNGIPVVVLEFKSAVQENTTIMDAYKQLTIRYRRDIPEIFKYNAFVVISDGANNKYGSFFSPYDFFYAWRKINSDDKELDGINSLVTMIKGLFRKDRLLEVIKDFIYFPDTYRDGLVVHDQRQRISVLHSVHLCCTEMQLLGQHLQIAPDDGRGNIHDLLRPRVNLDESLVVPAVSGFHIRDDGLALKQLFLLRFVKAFQRRRFQCRIEDHVRLATFHADKSESGTAFHRFSVLVGDTHGKNGRMASVVNIIKDVHRQILDHLLREPESGKRRKGNLFKFKMRLFHTISSL